MSRTRRGNISGIAGIYNTIRTFHFLAELKVSTKAHNGVYQSARSKRNGDRRPEVPRRALPELLVILWGVEVRRESEVLQQQAHVNY